jgi:hypothetical protein
MGYTGIDSSVKPYYNQDEEDALLVKLVSKTNANNNTISAESRTFADNVEANILASIAEEELALVA